MGTTLAELRSALRIDLADTDAAAYRWSDAALDRHVRHALQEVQEAAPIGGSFLKTIVTPATHRVTLTADVPSTFLWVDAVEYPLDEYPRKLFAFREEPGPAIYLIAEEIPPAGVDVRVWYARG